MIIKGARRNIAAPKKVDVPAAAPKKERKAHKVVPPVVEPEVIEAPVEKTETEE